MFGFEWNGHKIEWELLAPKSKLFLRLKTVLYVDGQLIGETKKRVNSGEFTHDGEKHKIKMRLNIGLIEFYFDFWIDGKKVHREKAPFKYIKDFIARKLREALIGFLIGLLGGALISVILFIPIIYFAFDGRLYIPTRDLDLTKVPGTIYLADSVGNLITYRPSTGAIDTILKTDSMVVTAISPDRKSAIAMDSRDSKYEISPERKIYWITLTDGKMRLIVKTRMREPNAYFTPDGSKIVLPAIKDTTFLGSLVADTTGKTKIFDSWEIHSSPSGEKFIGRRTGQRSYSLLFWDDKEPQCLDSVLAKAEVDFWNEETLVIFPFKFELKLVLFAPIGGGKIDSLHCKGYSTRVIHGENRVIASRRWLFLIFDPKNEFQEKWLYDRDSLLWSTTSKGYVWGISPDRDYYIGTVFPNIKSYKYNFTISGKRNACKDIPFDGNYRFLGWFE